MIKIGFTLDLLHSSVLKCYAIKIMKCRNAALSIAMVAIALPPNHDCNYKSCYSSYMS